MSDDALRMRARALGLYGLVARWDEVRNAPWLPELIAIEETERRRRSLERRVKNARTGRFKPMADFDWAWPRLVDRDAIEELFSFGFADPKSPANVVLVGPNGTGKTMIAQNLAHQAVLRGFTVKFTSASAMLNDLAAQDGAKGLQLAFRRYCRPHVLVLDEVGYLSYDNRHADLLFEIVTRRYGQKPIVVTTNKPFSEWNEVFPNAACVVTLVDRLVHASEIVKIEGESYRLKEAKERAERKAKGRRVA
jgi:DNA replication protein DnaC